MNPDIQAILIFSAFLTLALLVAFLSHKVSAQVDLKTLTPFLQEVYTKAIEQAETRAKATATPLDDIAVNAVKSVASPYIGTSGGTITQAPTIYPTPQPPYTVTSGTVSTSTSTIKQSQAHSNE